MFELKESKKIELLDVNAQVYEHSQFNTKHIHLNADNDEKVFMVAFRTIPEDSTGVAHILEHTSLCGSKKYPVRDPFFMMIRRSLNSFMNAFTSSDWTAYPFATQNDKDFNNLLDVYVDSAFFPKLDPLDFSQEGHRLEINENNELEIKGVVFNEMKGAMSSPTDQLWHGMSKHLFEETTYHHNSGGDPEKIIDLTHSDLVNFHQRHYHPSNATFFTFGNVAIDEVHSHLEENVFQKFVPAKEQLTIKPAKRFSQPVLASGTYQPIPGDEENHHVVISWLLGDSHDPLNLLEKYFLSNILLDNSASPLRKALELSKIGKSPSPFLGIEPSNKEIVFMAGLEGVGPDQSSEVEELILNTLKNLVSDGIPKDLIESSLHQLEIGQREVSGGGMPYGLQLMLGCMNACIHYDDPISMLDLDSNFSKLKELIEEDGYLENLISTNLLSNPHRLNYELKPDKKFNENLESFFSSTLKDKEQSLTNRDKEDINDLAKALKIRQEKEDDVEILPKVTIADIPLKREYPQESYSRGCRSVYEAGTNGLVYSDFLFPCQNLTSKELQFSSLYTFILTEIGLGDSSYDEIQALQSKLTGGINGSFKLHTIDPNSKGNLLLSISSKCLEENFGDMEKLIFNTLKNARFDEESRILDLFNIFIARNEESLNQNGHILAMNSAASSLNALSASSFNISGLEMLHQSKAIISNIKNVTDAKELIEILKTIHSKIKFDPVKIFTALSPGALKDKLKEYKEIKYQPQQDLIHPVDEEIAWVTGSQVCYCAEAFQSVSREHPDAPSLTVLATVLRNGFLHTAIREKGGAYGAGATNDTSTNTFKFFSYRDPKCKETFSAFKDSIEWALTSITHQHLEEAILGVVSSIDKPLSPVGEAKNDFNLNLENISPSERLAMRQNVINCSIDDLIRVSKKYLSGRSKKSILAGQSFVDEAKKMGLKIKEV
ncbi:peptidase M16C associated [SAR86 cluster bacterium SAR86E]|jgi:Zn-dependent M16 (insulinase) family peptidase|uniref:Peptidase M16C associated n=1 Tax=SAR86 cluster bacterium SAR86E TaxID=1208365 RepID=K6GGZ7_9GAMM|nr:peptidase M16C associated [SAR86 cluster bacterium SAR86E]